jgi:hypothetical protein
MRWQASCMTHRADPAGQQQTSVSLCGDIGAYAVRGQLSMKYISHICWLPSCRAAQAQTMIITLPGGHVKTPARHHVCMHAFDTYSGMHTGRRLYLRADVQPASRHATSNGYDRLKLLRHAVAHNNTTTHTKVRQLTADWAAANSMANIQVFQRYRYIACGAAQHVFIWV